MKARASGPVPRGRRFSRAASVRIAREEIVSGPQPRAGFGTPGPRTGPRPGPPETFVPSGEQERPPRSFRPGGEKKFPPRGERSGGSGFGRGGRQGDRGPSGPPRRFGPGGEKRFPRGTTAAVPADSAAAAKRNFHRVAVSEVAEAASAATIGRAIVAVPARRAVLVRAARRNFRRAASEAKIAAPVPAPGEEIAPAVRREGIDLAVHHAEEWSGQVCAPGARVPVQGSSVAGDHQASRQDVRAAGREVVPVVDREVAPVAGRVDVRIVLQGKGR